MVGKGVAIKSLNGLIGDALSMNIIDDQIAFGDVVSIKLRGSGGRTIQVDASDVELLDKTAMAVEEKKFQALKKAAAEASAEGSPKQHLQARLLAHELGDEMSYLINEHTDPKTFEPMPKEIENKVLARMVECFYVSHGLMPPASERSMTSFAQCLRPFVRVDNGGAVSTTTSGTLKDCMDNICQSIKINPSESGRLLVTVNSFSQWIFEKCQENAGPLAVAFITNFAALQLLAGNVLVERDVQYQILESVDSFFREHGSDWGSKLNQFRMPTKSKAGATCNSNHLIWSLSIQCLRMSTKLHELYDNSTYENLLPLPFENMTNEMQKLMNEMAFSYRPGGPATYLSSYQFLMSVLDLIIPENHDLWLANAYRLIQTGLMVVQENGKDPFFMYTFRMLGLLWTPTSFLSSSLSCEELENQILEVKALKRHCDSYVNDIDFIMGQSAELELKAYLNALEIRKIPNFPVPKSPSAFMYFTCRFTNPNKKTGMEPGGRYDRLHATKHRCSGCPRWLFNRNKSCSRCKNAHYCNRECQVKHWRHGGHKQECQERPKKEDGTPDEE